MPDLIADPDALSRALTRLSTASSLAVDTESDSFHAYRPKVCLLQVSAEGRDYLFDPLSGIDLGGLGGILADPAREIVLHAAENDVILLRHQFGWRIARLFDTQVACFVLGETPYSLAGILEARFGVKLDKSQQRSDWARRPLEPRQLAYAAEDTRHLLALAAELKARAAAAGRTEEIESECARIAAREWTPEPFDPEGFWSINGARDLDGVGARILRDLYLFRHGEADRRNWAPFRIVGDATLVAIARERIVRAQRGVPESFWRRYGERVAGVVRAAIDRGPLPRPQRQRERGTPMAPEVKRRYEALRRWRSAAAAKRGVESFVVARNEMLAQVAALEARSPDDLAAIVEPWRLREYGAAMIAAMLDGRGDRGDNGPSEK